MVSLYRENSLQQFWKLTTPIDDTIWQKSSEMVIEKMKLPCENHEGVLSWSLGEGKSKQNDWRLSLPKQIYYHLKPLIPHAVSRHLRRFFCAEKQNHERDHLYWPIDDRLVDYLWGVLACVLEISGQEDFEMVWFWPDRKQNAFVLTHDIETEFGQAHVDEIAKVDAEFGFRSAFFFVCKRYNLDMGLIQSLKDRGFEIGIHGFNHDGKLFCMRTCPEERFAKIKQFADHIGAKSFRSPMTLRDPYRMQSLDLPYDLSYFDTDPFEPMPGGTKSVFPFQMGKLLELPYTLAQDYTLFELLKETTPKTWNKKVDYLRSINGMILLDSHPDYLMLGKNLDVYREFLEGMQRRKDGLYHALPAEVGEWWQERSETVGGNISGRASITKIIKNTQTQSLSFIL